MSTLITGRFLAHNRLDQNDRNIIGLNLRIGKLQLTEPTIIQSAMLARADRAAVSFGFKRLLAGRAELAEQEELQNVQAFEAELINFIRSVGIGRVIDAAVKAEAKD
jgi:hypothetical protein